MRLKAFTLPMQALIVVASLGGCRTDSVGTAAFWGATAASYQQAPVYAPPPVRRMMHCTSYNYGYGVAGVDCY